MASPINPWDIILEDEAEQTPRPPDPVPQPQPQGDFQGVYSFAPAGGVQGPVLQDGSHFPETPTLADYIRSGYRPDFLPEQQPAGRDFDADQSIQPIPIQGRDFDADQRIQPIPNVVQSQESQGSQPANTPVYNVSQPQQINPALNRVPDDFNYSNPLGNPNFSDSISVPRINDPSQLAPGSGIQPAQPEPQVEAPNPNAFGESLVDFTRTDPTARYITDKINERNERQARNLEVFEQEEFDLGDRPIAAVSILGDQIMKALHVGFDFPAKTITSNTSVPGTGVSTQEFIGALGSMLNRMSNPFSENFTGATPLAGQQFLDELQGYRDLRSYVASLPADQQFNASVVYANSGVTGPEKSLAVAERIANKDARVEELWVQANQAIANGNWTEASQAASRAVQEQRKTHLEIVEENVNPLADFMFGLFVDPVNAVGPTKALLRKMTGAPPEQVAKFYKEMQKLDGLKPSRVNELLDGALTKAEELAERVEDGQSLRTLTQQLNPFARTAQSDVDRTTFVGVSHMSQLLGKARNKEEAQAIIQGFLSGTLNNGVFSPSSPLADEDGFVTFANSQIVNEAILRELPVLKQFEEAFFQLKELQGTGPVNKVKLISEIDGLIYNETRKLNGLTNITGTPSGAARATTKADEDGRAIVQYLNDAGEVVGETAGQAAQAANRAAADFNKAVKQAGGNVVWNGLRFVSGVQKGFLSSMYLNLRPGNWVRQAGSQMAAALTDDGNMTFARNADIIDDLARFGGGIIPDQEITDIVNGGTRAIGAQGEFSNDGRSIFRLGGLADGKWNLLASLDELGSKIWSDNTSVAGRVPVGEKNFRLRIFKTAFDRAWNYSWRNLSDEWARGLEQQGVAPVIANQLRGRLRELGQTVDQQEALTQMRRLLDEQTWTPSLSDLGIDPSLLGPRAAEIYRDVQDLFRSEAPLTPQTWRSALNDLRETYRDQGQGLLSAAPPAPGRHIFTNHEINVDVAEQLDALTQEARNLGLDPTTALDQLRPTLDRWQQASRGLWQTLQDELANGATPQAVDNVLAFWKQWRDAQMLARGNVDYLGRQAVEQGTPDAWAAKWEETARIYDGLADDLNTLSLEALERFRNGEAPDSFSIEDLLETYAQIDDASLAAARSEGLGNPAQNATAGRYERVVGAHRAFVDQGRIELMTTFRSYPSPDNLDIVVSAEMDNLRDGRRVRAILDEEKAKGLSGERLQRRANKLWWEYFDNARLRLNTARLEIVQNGLAQQAGVSLVWNDAFAGGQFQLLRPLENGNYLARRLDDGSAHEFSTAENSSALPEVPQSILDAYEQISSPRLRQQAEAAADSLRIPQQPTVDDLRRVAAYSGIGTFTENTNRAYDNHLINVLNRELGLDITPGSRPVDASEDLRSQVSALQETRRTLADLWDQVATAGNAENNINQAILTYRRDGVVRLPENFGEDLVGQTIAGVPINSTTDIENLLQQYADMSDEITRLQGEISSVRSSVDDSTYLEDLTDDQLETAMQLLIIRADEGADLGDDALSDIFQFRAANPYTPNPNHEVGAFDDALEEGEDLFDAITSTNRGRDSEGATWQPVPSEVVHHQQDMLDSALDKLLSARETIVNGVPNQIPGPQKAAIQAALNGVTNAWDNALTTASNAGRHATDFAMINYSQRRNFDTLLSMVSPFHFYWSRAPLIWAQRTARKPSIANFYYEWEEAIRTENEQENLPFRLQGTIPLPGTDRRVANPMNWILPFSGVVNDFSNPDTANNNYERFMKVWSKYGPGILPLTQIAADYGFDQTHPLGGGEEDSEKTRLQSLQAGDYLPIGRVAAYGYSAFSGQLPPGQFGDEFDYGRVGRAVSLEVADGRGSSAAGGYALGALEWMQENNSRDFDAAMENLIPEAQPYKDEIRQILEAATQRAGWDRFSTVASNFMLGNGLYDNDETEQSLRNLSQEGRLRGYDVFSNPGGSQAALDEFNQELLAGTDEQTGDVLRLYRDYRQLYPQILATSDIRDPALKTAVAEYWGERLPILERQGQERADFFAANIDGIDKDELRALKDQHRAELDAQAEKYPSLPEREGRGQSSTFGANPVEQARIELEGILKYNPPGRPTYPTDGTPEQISQYFDERREWELRKLNEIQRRLVQAVTDPEGAAPRLADQPLYTDVIGQYAADLALAYENRYNSELETLYNLQQEVNGLFNEQQGQARESRIERVLGAEALSLYNEYRGLPKQSKEREQFRSDNPIISQINMLAYDPQAWDEARSTFGPNIFDLAASYPGGGTRDEKRAWRESVGQEAADSVFAYFAWNRERRDSGTSAFPQAPQAGTPEADALLRRGLPPIGDVDRQNYLSNVATGTTTANTIPAIQQAAVAAARGEEVNPGLAPQQIDPSTLGIQPPTIEEQTDLQSQRVREVLEQFNNAGSSQARQEVLDNSPDVANQITGGRGRQSFGRGGRGSRSYGTSAGRGTPYYVPGLGWFVDPYFASGGRQTVYPEDMLSQLWQRTRFLRF